MIRRLCCLLAGFWLVACTTDQTALPVTPVMQPVASTPVMQPVARPVTQPVASAPSMDPIAGASASAQDGTVVPNRTVQAGPDDGALQKPAKSRRQSAAARHEPAANKKPAPALDQKRLVGMDQGELSNLLGKPSLLRGEQDAQVWQYGGASCVLHVFLYRDGTNGRYRVAYVDTVSRQQRHPIQADDAAFRQTCLDRLPHRVTAQNQPS